MQPSRQELTMAIQSVLNDNFYLECPNCYKDLCNDNNYNIAVNEIVDYIELALKNVAVSLIREKSHLELGEAWKRLAKK